MDRKPSFALFFILLLISPYPILAAAVEKETARKRDKRVAFALSLGAIAAIPWLKAGLVAASGAVALAVAARASARVTRVCILFKRDYIYMNLHHPAGGGKLIIFFLLFPENSLWHFMQIVFVGDNMHEVSVYFPGKNKKQNISKCRLQKFLPKHSTRELSPSLYFDGKRPRPPSPNTHTPPPSLQPPRPLP